MTTHRLLPFGLALALLASPVLAQDATPTPEKPAETPAQPTEATTPAQAMDTAPAMSEGGLVGGASVAAQGGTNLDDSSKLQQYETVPEGAFLDSAWLRWTGSDDRFMEFQGSKLGLDDQYASLAIGKARRYRLTLSWDENPNWMSNTARSPFVQTAPGVFRVPDGMRLGLQNTYTPWVAPTSTNPSGIGSCANNATLSCFFATEPWVADAPPIDLRYERHTGRAHFGYKASEAWTFAVSGARETREGNKNTTFYGGPSYEVATPIDYVTTDLRAEAEFARGRWFANASANFNTFTNEILYATIDNPQRLQMTNPSFPTARPVFSDSATFRLWLPPDNDAYTVDASAGLTLPRSHKVTGSFSMGSMQMEHENIYGMSANESITTNPVNPAFSNRMPNAVTEAQFDTLMGALRFTGDPSPKFGYILSFRTFEMKDETEEYEFLSTVRGDVGASVRAATDPIVRHHEGWSKRTLRGEVHVLPVDRLRLAVSYGQDKNEYDRREYEDVTDKTWQVAADYGISKVNLHLAFNHINRSPGTEAEHPPWQGATQTDIAERSRNIFSGFLTYTPVETVAVAFNAMRQTNDFPAAVTGLTEQSFDTYGVDFTWAPKPTFSASAGYVYEKYFFDMAAAYFPRGVTIPPNFDPAADPNFWSNATEDRVDTFRVGFDWAPKPDRFDVQASLDYTKPRSDSNYTFVPGGAGEANGVWPATPVTGFTSSTFSGFPQVSKNFLIGKVQLNYHVMKNLTATALYWKQKFDNEDWQSNLTWPNGNGGLDYLMSTYMGHVDPGANRWIFLGARVPSYDADIFRVALTYTF
jgi:MtrB/PioB family decaheme-associated outer membrane protein